jgi:hypothetical protein
MKMNRAYVRRLEDLIVHLDATLSDMEAAERKGYLTRDMPALHREADRIRGSRATMGGASNSKSSSAQ